MENELDKMTAVEWLFEQIARRQGSILHTIPFYNENQDLLIQAKEMEQLQMYLPTDEEIENINPYSYGKHHSGGKYEFWIVSVQWIIHHIKSKREGKIK